MTLPENSEGVDNMDLVQLRAALAKVQLARDEALQSLENLQSESKAAPTPKVPECFLLKKIPPEIRNQLYKLLLTNEVLSKNCSISKSGAINYTHEKKYDLAPQLLRSCRQIYAEASILLFNRPFCVMLAQDTTASLNRIDSADLEDHEAVRKVKHWRVIIGARNERYPRPQAPTPSFVLFCRAICQHRPKSLTVSLVPRGNCLLDPSYFDLDTLTTDYHDVTKVLKPLRMLRNIGRVSIVAGGLRDFPVYTQPAPGEIQPHEISPALVAELLQLAQGDTPVKDIFLMYRKLVAYAQTFERNEQFKSAMDPRYGQALHRLRPSDNDMDRDCNGGNWGSPYRGSPFHPVENALDYASAACKLGKVSTFLEARKAILEYLEPQYHRILDSSLQLLESIKEHEVPGSFLSAVPPTRFSPRWPPAEAMLLLGDDANAFVRDAPWATRVKMRNLQCSHDLSYARLPREVLMHQLTTIVEEDSYSYSGMPEFTKLFKHAVDDMDTQLLEIRKARKELFDKDYQDFGHDVDLELWRCDEKVKRGINEPRLEPRYLPTPQEHQRIEAERRNGNKKYDLVTWGWEI